ncbi:hypothetical protein PRIPAC_71290 [Pristionchus pacificus]|uniref:Medium-chain acyl-CoA ligase ACSF2, mitochondrial n=1 Tax=Pristionchus pacificus TaxID=54126 RepID=A0A2A6CRL4_PRIPA|nr:hypothetical protein PRIPAC_71290 [Pristionchus pacificus]|eukprot:PDM80845.1 AMP-binding protein [Pristionchus pacificus]
MQISQFHQFFITHSPYPPLIFALTFISFFISTHRSRPRRSASTPPAFLHRVSAEHFSHHSKLERLLTTNKTMSFRRIFARLPYRYAKRTAHSYVHGTSAHQLLYETIGARFRSAVEAVPDKTLYVFDHQNIRKTYGEAYSDARRLACALLELGLKPGDCVGIWGPNHYEWVTCQMATAIGGFIQVNINPSYQSEELRFALEKVGVRCLITPRAHKKSNYFRTLHDIIPNLASAKAGSGHIKCRNLPDLEHIVLFGEHENVKGAWRYEDLMMGVGSTSENRLKSIEDTIRVDDPVNIQYTSGTTGYPKGATLTHHNLLNNSHSQGLRSMYDHGDHIICIPNPLYHCFGSTMGVLNALSHKQTTVFPDAGFNPLRTLEVVAKERCTSLYGTPTMFIDILAHLEEVQARGLSVNSLNAGYIAGAPCPFALCDRLVNELGMRNLSVLYGSTEMSPVVTMSRLEHAPSERIKNVGYVMDHVELLVVDDEGQVVPRGTKGELLARGYCNMRGYYNDEERTKKELTADRWYHTGDTASISEDGAVNIVIGVPDERMGEAVCAWIRLREGVTDVTPEMIKEACKGKIAHYKIPKYVLIKKEADFPLTATGKVKKYELRLMSKKELGLEQVIGVPDERMGEAVCAWIRLREGVTDVTPEMIKEACKGKADFPLTATGKVKKYELRLMSKKELGLEQVRSHFNEDAA